MMMFNRAELALLKKVFSENDDLLYAIRKVLLQFPLSASDTAALNLQLTPEVLGLVRRRLMDNMDGDTPLTQLGDLNQTLSGDLRTHDVEGMAVLFDAKILEIDYLEQQFKKLEDRNAEEKIRLADLAVLKHKAPHQMYRDTVARNFLLGFIDPYLYNIKMLAGTKEETPEEQEKRLTRDSSK